MIAGNHWARQTGSDKAVTLDMGGTSADVGVVVDGQLKFSGLFEVEFGIPIALPIIDVTTIGAGGSSIASIDYGGMLRVGPESAGADSGPGVLRPGWHGAHHHGCQPHHRQAGPGLLPGWRDRPRCGAVGDRRRSVAGQLGLSTADAADAIISVSIENMAGAVRLVTVDRGYDYRDFDLVAFGGAGRCTPPRSRAGWACAGSSCPRHPDWSRRSVR